MSAALPIRHAITALAALQVVSATAPRKGRTAFDAPARLQALIALLEFRRLQRRGLRPCVHLDDGRTLRTLKELASALAARLGLTTRTIMRWWQRLNSASGYDALADRGRFDRGRSRRFRNLRAAAFVIDGAAQGHSISRIHRELVAAWPRLSNDGLKPPSRSAVRDFLKRLARPTGKKVRP